MAASTPLLVDVQADLLDGLDSRVVIPLRRLEQFPKVKLPERLAPVFRIEGQDLVAGNAQACGRATARIGKSHHDLAVRAGPDQREP